MISLLSPRLSRYSKIIAMNAFSTIPFVFSLSVILAVTPVKAHNKDAKAPHEVGGFVLGSKVEDYPDVIESNFLKEMVVTDWHGFRKGIISYGVCQHTNRILSIRLKYEDSSKRYFQKLLKEFKKKFGPPDEWKGDSFGILHIWKWHFIDNENNAVTLNLQHNLRNPNENIGNMVKLSYPDMIQEEQKCFIEMCAEIKDDDDKERREEIKKPDWHYLIPR